VKQEAAYFEGKEPVLVYIGKKLKDSLRLEEIFTAANVDYGVEADEYRGGVIFRSVRAGAFFYVLPETADAAFEIMRCNGYKPYIGAPPDLG
jgi:hypothetical protein